MNDIVLLCLIALSVSTLFSGLMIKAGIGDVPDSRSSHVQPTPTGGGVGMVGGLGVGVYFVPLCSPLMIGGAAGGQFAQILSLIWAAAFLGLIDDLQNIRPTIKFAVILALAWLAVLVTGPVTELPGIANGLALPGWLAFAGCVLWVFVITNIVNFMDGINGILIGVMAPAFAALGAVGLLRGGYLPALICLLMAAGLAGFAPYNFRARACIFAGDVGALLTGFTYSVCALWICTASAGLSPVYIAPVLILPFLADSLLTLLRRAIHKEPLLRAHNSHLYQRLVRSGWSHLRTSLAYMAVSLLLIAYTAILYKMDKTQSVYYWVVPSLVLTYIYIYAGLKIRKKLKAPN